MLAGIGQKPLGANHNVQPLDIVALQETTSNSATVNPIINGLNSYYNSPGMYAQSPVQAGEASGNPGTGNGPNAIVYNTHTLQLVASVPVAGTGDPNTNPVVPRQAMRYEFAPAGHVPTADNEFYVYVSHYKANSSGDNSLNIAKRVAEATAIRAGRSNLARRRPGHVCGRLQFQQQR